VSDGFDLWMATRTTDTDLFSPPENLTVVNSPSTEADPMLSRDDRELFFVSSRGGSRELWRSVRECL
jgi:Tol biopolymer transport system component